MENTEKYIKVFTEVFGVTKENASELKYQSIDAWDSVGHMGLIAALEENFDIMLEADDIVDFSSFEKGKEILSKYNVQF